MIQKMSKIQLIAPRPLMSEIMRKIYDYGRVHIDKVEDPLNEGDKEGGSLKEVQLTAEEANYVSRLEHLSKRSEEISSYLRDEVKTVKFDKGNFPARDISGKETAELAEVVKGIESDFNKIRKERAVLRKLQSDLEDIVKAFGDLASRAQNINDKAFVCLSVAKKDGAEEFVKSAANRLSEGAAEVFSADMGNKNLGVLVAVPEEYAVKIEEELVAEEGIEIPFPDEYKDRALRDVLAQLEKKKTTLPDELKKADAKLAEFGKGCYGTLQEVRKAAAEKLAVYKVVDNFVETKFTFVMLGWIVSDRLEPFKQLMTKAYGEKVIVEELHIKEKEQGRVPVSLKNNSYIRRFEVCLSAFRPPLYGGMDPTWMISIFFPVIFGMILGDMAYGVAALLFATFLKSKGKKNKALADLSFIFYMCGLSTIVFGFLYGEVMGTLGHYLGLTPILVNREHIPGMMAPLALTVGFGTFHIILSLVLKMVNAYKHHNSINAHVVEALSYIVIILMLVCMLLITLGQLPKSLMTPSIIITVVAYIAAFASGGIAGGLEIFGTIGNILSYSRIMAIGLQSVIMAMVANIITVKAPSLIFGIILCILIHAINIILGLFGPTIHGLRLHFVENFTKFVKLEGVRYQPFGRGGEEIA